MAPSSYGINSTTNVIIESDDKWELQVDIRAMLDQKAEALDAALNRILDTIDGKLEMNVSKSIGFIATSEDSPLVRGASRVLGQLGYSDKPAERGGATDGRFFAYHEIETIDIGAIGYNVHGPNETVTVKSIRDLVKFFELVVYEIVKDYRK
ncbi:MAG: M20/M25/M40 family metallo-hydrolase [Candidatus Heimdallarchaeota archaeon]|nr:M20/M25/M40 family metallo-hydrolase [Candidatus Heimdallarchaeota archaeon]